MSRYRIDTRTGEFVPGRFPNWALDGISGAEGGYNTQGDIVTVTADGRDITGLWTEFQQTLDIYNARRTALVGILTFPVTQVIEDVPVVGEVEFEESSEFGVPKAVRPRLNYQSLGYDLRDYDIATRFTWRFIRDANANQVQAIHQQVLNGDNRLLFRRVMEAMYDNRDRKTLINVTNYQVYPLYNADGFIPPPFKNTTFDGTHNHYLVSEAAIWDSDDFMDMYNAIAEHGYGIEQGTTFVVLCNQTEVDTARKWRAGVGNGTGHDPSVPSSGAAIADYDFIPAASQPTLIIPNAEGLLGDLPPSTWNGLPVVGSYGGVLIVHEDYIPAGYPLMIGSGGQGNLQNPVGLREHANPAYRGLRLLSGNQQGYPLIDSYYSRTFGTGVRQRGGAVVMMVGTGAYVIPPAYKKGNGNG